MPDERLGAWAPASVEQRLDRMESYAAIQQLVSRYAQAPGIAVRSLKVVECRNSHATKMRLRVELNDVGVAAGIPERVCLKMNLSGLRTGLICGYDTVVLLTAGKRPRRRFVPGEGALRLAPALQAQMDERRPR